MNRIDRDLQDVTASIAQFNAELDELHKKESHTPLTEMERQKEMLLFQLISKKEDQRTELRRHQTVVLQNLMEKLDKYKGGDQQSSQPASNAASPTTASPPAKPVKPAAPSYHKQPGSDKKQQLAAKHESEPEVSSDDEMETSTATANDVRKRGRPAVGGGGLSPAKQSPSVIATGQKSPLPPPAGKKRGRPAAGGGAVPILPPPPPPPPTTTKRAGLVIPPPLANNSDYDDEGEAGDDDEDHRHQHYRRHNEDEPDQDNDDDDWPRLNSQHSDANHGRPRQGYGLHRAGGGGSSSTPSWTSVDFGSPLSCAQPASLSRASQPAAHSRLSGRHSSPPPPPPPPCDWATDEAERKRSRGRPVTKGVEKDSPTLLPPPLPRAEYGSGGETGKKRGRPAMPKADDHDEKERKVRGRPPMVKADDHEEREPKVRGRPSKTINSYINGGGGGGGYDSMYRSSESASGYPTQSSSVDSMSRSFH